MTSTYSVVAQITTSPSQCMVVSADPNGNHDSGYAPSHVEETIQTSSTPPASPEHQRSGSSGTINKQSLQQTNGSPKRDSIR